MSIFDKMPDLRPRKGPGAGTLRKRTPRDDKGRYELATLLLDNEKDSAISYLEAAANDNHAASLDLLGMLYAVGEVVEKDPKRAFSYFKKAATLGDTNGKYHYAMALREGFGCKSNPETSFAWLRMAAKDGQPEAMFSVAQTLEKGFGTQKDQKQAEFLFASAAKEGHREAICRQIEHFLNGPNINFREASRWIKLAASEDIPVGMLTYARQILESPSPDVIQAITLLERAVSIGDVLSMCELAWLWKDGLFTKKDMVQAIVYAHMASSNNHLNAKKWLEEWRAEADADTLMQVIEIISLGNREEIIRTLRLRQETLSLI